MRLWKIISLLLALPLCAESALLKNGFRMRVDRHVTEDQTIRLFLPGGGTMQVAAGDIDRFEPDEPAIVPAATPVPVPAAVPVTRNQPLDEIVRAASARHGLDPDFIHSIIAAESAGNPRAVSPKGASGLMQLMPGTAKALGTTDVFDPAMNVEGGTAYIKQLLERYDNDVIKALAAYNAGPGKVDAYGGLPPYRETNAYVTRVITKFNKEKVKQGVGGTASAGPGAMPAGSAPPAASAQQK